MDFNEIYKEYAEMIYRFLLRMCHDEYLAEDLMQDTFLKAIEKINTFDMRCKLSTWLCQIAKNTYFDYLRKQQKQDDMQLQEETLTETEVSIEELLMSAEGVREIHKMIHGLSEPYKEVFLLRYYADLSYQEIGNMFNKTEVWGRVTYLRSKEMLIRMIENNRMN